MTEAEILPDDDLADVQVAGQHIACECLRRQHRKGAVKAQLRQDLDAEATADLDLVPQLHHPGYWIVRGKEGSRQRLEAEHRRPACGRELARACQQRLVAAMKPVEIADCQREWTLVRKPGGQVADQLHERSL